jgi:propanol-preferring alcohol dehydrogenase
VAGAGELLLKVQVCGICRTDLHVVDGELTEPLLPLIPGHQIVGVVEAVGIGARGFHPGDMVGVPGKAPPRCSLTRGWKYRT